MYPTRRHRRRLAVSALATGALLLASLSTPALATIEAPPEPQGVTLQNPDGTWSTHKATSSTGLAVTTTTTGDWPAFERMKGNTSPNNANAYEVPFGRWIEQTTSISNRGSEPMTFQSWTTMPGWDYRNFPDEAPTPTLAPGDQVSFTWQVRANRDPLVEVPGLIARVSTPSVASSNSANQIHPYRSDQAGGGTYFYIQRADHTPVVTVTKTVNGTRANTPHTALAVQDGSLVQHSVTIRNDDSTGVVVRVIGIRDAATDPDSWSTVSNTGSSLLELDYGQSVTFEATSVASDAETSGEVEVWFFMTRGQLYEDPEAGSFQAVSASTPTVTAYVPTTTVPGRAWPMPADLDLAREYNQTVTSGIGSTNTVSGASPPSAVLKTVDVAYLRPIIPVQVTTMATETVVAGGTAHDTAIVTGDVPPGAYVTFDLYHGQGPAPVCEEPFVSLTDPVLVAGPGEYRSGDVQLDVPGDYYWIETLHGSDGTVLHRGQCGAPGETTTVTPAPEAPVQVTTLATETIAVGGNAHDIATVTGHAPTGAYLTFELYHSDEATPVCDEPLVSLTDPISVEGPGQYRSGDVHLEEVGNHYWVETLHAPDGAVLHRGACGAPGETTTVTPAPPERPEPRDDVQSANPSPDSSPSLNQGERRASAAAAVQSGAKSALALTGPGAVVAVCAALAIIVGVVALVMRRRLT